MSVSDTIRKAGPFAGNGAQTAFPFTFKIFAAADIKVTSTDANGVDTALALTANYTVAINGDQTASPGGTVTALVAPATGVTLTITGNMAATQPLSIVNGGAFYAQNVSDALDRATILIQQLKELCSRAVSLPVSALAGVSAVLPPPGGGRYLRWNIPGTAIEAVAAVADPGTYIATGSGAVSRSITSKLGDFMFAADFGVVADGVTDDTTAFAAARAAAFAQNKILMLPADKTILCAPFTIDSSNAMPGLWGANTTIKAKTGSTGPLFTLNNPQGIRAGFEVRGINFDAAGRCANGVKIRGSQFVYFTNCKTINGTSHGWWLSGDVGFGIYYCEFRNCRGGDYLNANAGDGWRIETTAGGSNSVAANHFTNCQSFWNTQRGWAMVWSQNTYSNCDSEQNGNYGWYIDNCFSNDILGGYSENNYLSPGPDTSFVLSATATGVSIIGGRHIGSYSDLTVAPSNNRFMATNKQNEISDLKVRKGIGINANANQDCLNFGANNSAITLAGTSHIAFSTGLISHSVDTKFVGKVGFNNSSVLAKPSITGSRASNAALASLLTQLANYGLITDSTTA